MCKNLLNEMHMVCNSENSVDDLITNQTIHHPKSQRKLRMHNSVYETALSLSPDCSLQSYAGSAEKIKLR